MIDIAIAEMVEKQAVHSFLCSMLLKNFKRWNWAFNTTGMKDNGPDLFLWILLANVLYKIKCKVRKDFPSKNSRQYLF